MSAAVHLAIMAAHKAEKDLATRLTEATAINSASASMHSPSNAAEQAQLDEALGLGIVIRRADGRIYLNQRAVSERNEGMAYGLLLTLLALGSVAASIAALVMFATR